jgi:tetrahydromethanopterin S-methyltransferase subunit G
MRSNMSRHFASAAFVVLISMAMDVEAEIRDLKHRVSEIEGSFGFLTQQIKSVHKDLLAFQAITEQGFDKVGGRLDKVDGRVDRLEKGVRTLREDMPGIVASTMRDVLRERPRKSRKT